ncbi:MAG: hypothetical protein IJJ14_05310 [Coriobacteriales bacterium]|nr:hypothetical protein [Coriobacteriales bacterium]
MPDTSQIVTSRARVSGVFFVGPTTATLPTSASATFTGFDELGYVSSDGITQSIDRSSTKLVDMSGDVVKVIDGTHELQYRLKPYQLTAEFLKIILGEDNVTVTSGELTAATINSKALEAHAYIFDMMLSNGKLLRVVVPNAQLSAQGDIVFGVPNTVSSEMTITALPDANGNKAYYYFADAA